MTPNSGNLAIDARMRDTESRRCFRSRRCVGEVRDKETGPLAPGFSRSTTPKSLVRWNSKLHEIAFSTLVALVLTALIP